MTMPSQTVLIWLGVYVVVSLPMVIFLGSRKKETILSKMAGMLFVPGVLVWAPMGMIAATIYFWLYRERHMTTIDRHGTEEEKAALKAYRSALASETIWHRLLVKLRRRQPTAERIQAEKDMDSVWDRYQARMEPEGFTFGIRRAHMYNHVLRYVDQEGVTEVIIEESPDFKTEGFLVWELEFSQDPTRRKLILDRFVQWAENRKIRHTVLFGKLRG